MSRFRVWMVSPVKIQKLGPFSSTSLCYRLPNFLELWLIWVEVCPSLKILNVYKLKHWLWRFLWDVNSQFIWYQIYKNKLLLNFSGKDDKLFELNQIWCCCVQFSCQFPGQHAVGSLHTLFIKWDRFKVQNGVPGKTASVTWENWSGRIGQSGTKNWPWAITKQVIHLQLTGSQATIIKINLNLWGLLNLKMDLLMPRQKTIP